MCWRRSIAGSSLGKYSSNASTRHRRSIGGLFCGDRTHTIRHIIYIQFCDGVKPIQVIERTALVAISDGNKAHTRSTNETIKVEVFTRSERSSEQCGDNFEGSRARGGTATCGTAKLYQLTTLHVEFPIPPVAKL